MSSTRTLTRDPNNKVIAGVCSGIANYFGWDPTVVRVVFAISLLFGGTGFFIYLLLWIVMPEGPVIQPVEEFFFEEQVYPEPWQYGPQGQQGQQGQPYNQPTDPYGQPGQPHNQPNTPYDQPNDWRQQ